MTVALNCPESVNLEMPPGQTMVGCGPATALTVVGSFAVLLPVLDSPPPETWAVLVTVDGALQATLTVSVRSS